MAKQKESGICPLVNREITAAECIPVLAVVDGSAPLYEAPREFRLKSGWRDICKECKHCPKNQTEEPKTE